MFSVSLSLLGSEWDKNHSRERKKERESLLFYLSISQSSQYPLLLVWVSFSFRFSFFDTYLVFLLSPTSEGIMGREWFYWGGGGGGGARSSSSSAASASKKGKRSRKQLEVEDDGSAASPGCMCAVLQLFDLPHFQVVLNHHSHRSLSPVSSFVQDHPFQRPTGN